MKVCTHRGLLMAVLTRNEHCPPHVHVGSSDWEARLEFSFWHNGVRLMDVVPSHRQPTVAVLEGLRQALKTPTHLRRARLCWWQAMQSVCLVISSGTSRPGRWRPCRTSAPVRGSLRWRSSMRRATGSFCN